MLDHALQLAGRGWRIFPVHTTVNGACSCGRDCGKDAGKHPRIKAWQKHAAADPKQILDWWQKWPQSNIGVCTGHGLIVLDLDGPEEIKRFSGIAKANGGLQATLTAQTGRGFHLYFNGDLAGSKKVDDLLVRGEGGFVIAPPSWHASGKRYQWVKDVPLIQAPAWFMNWLQATDNKRVTSLPTTTTLRDLPDYVTAKKNSEIKASITKRASAGLSEVPQTSFEIRRITSALAAIPASCARDPWLHVGFALHSLGWQRPDGTDLGFELWQTWSATCPEKYSLHDVETRWNSFGKKGRQEVGIGTLYHIAESYGWTGLIPQAAKEVVQPATSHPFFQSPLADGASLNGHASAAALLPADESPLIELNEKYATIGDLGGKCMVLGWIPSKVDDTIRVPSFQTFKSFGERFANRYVGVADKAGDIKQQPLGAYWLRWTRRQSYEGIDLVPNAPSVLERGVLNLWQGFAVAPRQGCWERLKEHIAEILAEGLPEQLDYILRWSAWAVQHPGERAEVSLVFRGDKGSGKGTFAHALRRLFGQHGLHISNSKHLVGAFNAHLRNCLFLFADEAFWAGDKQGESVLKALITEPVLMIEQKGVDATQWRNRVHMIMAANAEWVVPASHDERRYAMFNVSNKKLRNEDYFNKLHDEINSGGLEAMLHDLLNVKLGDWHPRKVPNTEALRQQKIRSMTNLQEWWEQLLQEGTIPAAGKEAPDIAMTQYLMNHAREFAPRLRELTPAALGRFLSDHGCVKLHRNTGNAWRFPELGKARQNWERQYQGWKWIEQVQNWAGKS